MSEKPLRLSEELLVVADQFESEEPEEVSPGELEERKRLKEFVSDFTTILVGSREGNQVVDPEDIFF